MSIELKGTDCLNRVYCVYKTLALLEPRCAWVAGTWNINHASVTTFALGATEPLRKTVCMGSTMNDESVADHSAEQSKGQSMPSHLGAPTHTRLLSANSIAWFFIHVLFCVWRYHCTAENLPHRRARIYGREDQPQENGKMQPLCRRRIELVDDKSSGRLFIHHPLSTVD